MEFGLVMDGWRGGNGEGEVCGLSWKSGGEGTGSKKEYQNKTVRKNRRAASATDRAVGSKEIEKGIATFANRWLMWYLRYHRNQAPYGPWLSSLGVVSYRSCPFPHSLPNAHR